MRSTAVQVVLEWHNIPQLSPMTVALSLAEAAALRASLQQPRGGGRAAEVQVALRVLATNTLLEATPGCPGAAAAATAAATEDELAAALEAQRLLLRFFNGDSYYTSDELQLLEREVGGIGPQELEHFFRNVLACRRRRVANNATVLRLFPSREGEDEEDWDD